jgi:hypothetical protein
MKLQLDGSTGTRKVKTQAQIIKAISNKAYREEHKDDLRLKRLARDGGNKVKIKATNKKWYTNNKEKELLEQEDSPLITLKSISRLVGVKEIVIKTLRDNPTYNMPRPKMARCDGTDLYCRDEIEEWLPFIQEAVAFFPNKKKLIKISGTALVNIAFIRNNLAVIKYCDEIRRKQLLDGRITNGRKDFG